MTRCTGGAQKAELVARIIEQMQKDAALAEEEGDSEDEAMDLAQVQEKLEACSEAELKQMLKDMKLPTKGKVGAPASPTTPTASCANWTGTCCAVSSCWHSPAR